MKVNKLFCIDLDIYEKLTKIDNQSKLVNELLKQHFSYFKENNNQKESKLNKIKQFRAIIKQEKKDLRLIKLLNDNNFDQFCINWCYNKEFIYSDEDISTYLFSRRKKIGLEDFKKFAEIVKNNAGLFKKTG